MAFESETIMSFLSDEERAAIQAVSPLASGSRVKRAEALINPASGLANDYLNLFNEIVMLVEQLPTMPELFEDIERWRPTSYRDYFKRSILPGRGTTLEAYDRLDTRFRQNFESVVAELDRRATGAVAAVRKHFKGETDLEAADRALQASRCEHPARRSTGQLRSSTTARSSPTTSCRSAPTS